MVVVVGGTVVVVVVDVVDGVVTTGRGVGFLTTGFCAAGATVTGTVVVVVVGGIITSFHCAYNVTARDGMVNVALGLYEVPEPSAAVFQRLKVYPERLTAADDTVTDDANSTLCVVGSVPDPPFAL